MTSIHRLLAAGREPTRRFRRAVVVLGAISIPATAAFLYARPPGLDILLSIALLALLVAPLFVLGAYRRDPFRRSDVDERERQRRDETYRISYRILQPALAAVLIGGVLLHLLARPWFDQAWGPLILTGLWYVSFLPHMVFAWREPDGARD